MSFTCHNDTYVTPIDPLMSVWSAVNRVTAAGAVLGPELRVPVMEALRSVTSHAAYQGHEENIKGTLSPGKVADMVVLDRNPLRIDPMSIKDVAVVATIVADDVVYGELR
jgi:predicted amidohydrolase YtcJ